MNILNCIVVDDEPRAHAVLKNYIEKLNSIKLQDSFYNTMEAFEHLRTHPVDLVLLDINMPELDGFSLIEMTTKMPMVIFVTAYTEYAHKSYDYGAIDYLHKPIRFERFVKAIDKALKWRKLICNELQEIEIKVDGRVRSLPTSEIRYIESLGNYSKLVLKNSSTLILTSLKELEEKLPRSSFIRIHKSFIVNISSVNEIKDSSMAVAGVELPIGKTYKKYIAEYAGRTH